MCKASYLQGGLLRIMQAVWTLLWHDDIIKWKHFPCYWPFVCGIHQSCITGEFPSQRPVTQSFDIFFDLRLNRQRSKQPRGWWFETPPNSLWRHGFRKGWFYPYPLGLLHKHWGNHKIALVPVKQPWRIWLNVSYIATRSNTITTTNQSTTNQTDILLNILFLSMAYTVSFHGIYYFFAWNILFLFIEYTVSFHRTYCFFSWKYCLFSWNILFLFMEYTVSFHVIYYFFSWNILFLFMEYNIYFHVTYCFFAWNILLLFVEYTVSVQLLLSIEYTISFHGIYCFFSWNTLFLFMNILVLFMEYTVSFHGINCFF